MRLRLDLSEGFEPHSGGERIETIPFERLTFKGGEEHIRLKPVVPLPDYIRREIDGSEVIITHRLRSSSDVMALALAADAVIQAGGTPSAFLPYFPYARQDRVMVPGEPHSIRAFCRVLASMRFKCVTVFDPHSDVTPALVENMTVVDNQHFISWVLKELGGQQVVLVAPDAGALKKVYKLAEKLGFRGEIACGSKVRDVVTGEIVRQDVTGNVSGKHCLIVDDICDGGRTFIALGKALRKQGAQAVSLAVSHGIFSYGVACLFQEIGTVYTTDSYQTQTPTPGLHVYPLSLEG